MRHITAVALTTAASLLAACQGGVCAGVGRPAFEVAVLDAQTGASIVDSAVVYVYSIPDFARVDSATQAVSGRIWAAMEQTGRFTVVVERPGYAPWTVEDREVFSRCSVQTVSLTARLARLGTAVPAP